MKIADILNELETFAPLNYQEEYDNCGLITGERNWEAKGALLTLDCTEEIVEEAIKNQQLRLAKLDAAKRTSEMIKILALADVEEFKVDKDAGDKNTPSIGFKINS